MGTCVGPSKPQVTTSIQTDAQPKQQKPDQLPKLPNHNNSQQSQLLAAPSNHVSKVQLAPPAGSQQNAAKIEVIPEKQANHERSEQPLKDSKIGLVQQNANKQPQKPNPNNSLNIQVAQQVEQSWMKVSRTSANAPVNEADKQAAALKEEDKKVKEGDPSWLQSSNTPNISKLVHNQPGSAINHEPQHQVREVRPLSENLNKQPLQPIKEERESAENHLSSLRQKTENSNGKLLGSSQIPAKHQNVPENQAKHQNGLQNSANYQKSYEGSKEKKGDQIEDLEQMISSQPKYGGISMSDIRISKLQSNIIPRPAKPEHEEGQQSKVHWNNPSFVSPKQGGSAIYAAKVQELQNEPQLDPVSIARIKSLIKDEDNQSSKMMQAQTSHIANGNGLSSKGQNGQSEFKFGSKIYQAQNSKHDDSLIVKQVELMDSLQEIVMEESSSPLRGILWKSQLGIK